MFGNINILKFDSSCEILNSLLQLQQLDYSSNITHSTLSTNLSQRKRGAHSPNTEECATIKQCTRVLSMRAIKVFLSNCPQSSSITHSNSRNMSQQETLAREHLPTSYLILDHHKPSSIHLIRLMVGAPNLCNSYGAETKFETVL